MATATTSALARFAAKCEFDARTGCVLWVGGTTSAQGATAKYGAFWFEGRRWCAHRWAAQFIHGLEIEGLEVDHCCPADPVNRTPNTLCVQHLQAIPAAENNALRWGRVRWGWDEPGLWDRPAYDGPLTLDDMMPWHEPPDWFKPFLAERLSDSCPF